MNLLRSTTSSQTLSTLFSWDFSQSSVGWQGGFADYPAGEEDFYELDFGWQPLPAHLGDASALVITGNNHSDDLFMYFRNQVTGLDPNTMYNVFFDIELASDAPDGSFGIGGSPANSVYLKAGATLWEPLPEVSDLDSNFLELNVDKGYQSTGGRDGLVLGDIAKPPGDETFDYALITRNNDQQPFSFRTDDSGSAWIYFGTDSGFEGTTTLYYTNFRAEFVQTSDPTPIPEPTSFLPLILLGGWLLWRKPIGRLFADLKLF